MDRLEKYRNIVRALIREYARPKPVNGEIDTEEVADVERDHYEVLHHGWDRGKRVHGSMIHLDIIEGKIWIQHDATDRPVADALLEAGVPREDIVLGFHPANLRQFTEFAAG